MATKAPEPHNQTPRAAPPKQKLAPAVSNPKPENSPTKPTNPPVGRQNDNQGHRSSDVDSSKYAQHHTLGIGQNQSSPGAHNHDGVTSRKLVLANIDELWTDPVPFTPAWTAASANPALGNGTLIAYSIKRGRRVDYQLALTFGSSTTVGTGQYSFSLPYPVFQTPGNIAFWIFTGIIFNGGASFPCSAWIANGSLLTRIIPSDVKTGGVIGGGIGLGSTGWKAAWASGDFIYLSGWYPSAS